MEFLYRYHGTSQVDNTAQATDIQFAPDTLRDPTYFVADLGQPLAFRAAVSALHDVVVADLRTRPKDREAYFAWLAHNEPAMLAEFVSQKHSNAERLQEVRRELNEIYQASHALMRPYYHAQQRYFNYLLKTDYDAWLVLDPVISVHPDEVFFECFSQDESTYARLSCDYQVFDKISEHAYGTTNIDYSDALYKEFQKLRTYKQTQFKIDPRGFEVQTGQEDAYTEQKIDLPDSWVRGFLQVSSAMNLSAAHCELDPMDVHNICFVLRRRKERHGPRSLRIRLQPERPVTLVFEPWNLELSCPRSIYHGSDEQEIRLWGRRRLLTLERLIPIARRFHLHLLGSGLPAFVVADLGHMSFTLGLSGWTANDWSRMGNFDLMAPRAEVDEFTLKRVFKALQETWCESAASLARRLDLEPQLVHGALAAYTQAGRVIYDLVKDVYRVRELSREPLPMDKLRFSNEREARADNFVRADLVRVTERQAHADAEQISGTVLDDGREYHPVILIDPDERMTDARCDCYFYGHNKLFKGPCEHMLALRRQRTAMGSN